MTILELREKRNTAWNSAKAFLDSHRTEKGTLTAEDDATYSRMEQEIADLGKEIARLERQQVSNILQEGVDADGGYLVPEEKSGTQAPSTKFSVTRSTSAMPCSKRPTPPTF